MGDALFAVGYAIFTAMFCVQNLLSLTKEWQAAIYNVVTTPFNTRPFTRSGTTERAMNDIESPSELYEWMSTVFVDVLFSEQKSWDSSSTSWGSMIDWNGTYTPATVGSFNSILMVRLTSKLWEVERASAGAFDEYSPTALGGRRVSIINADSFYDSYEDQDALCPPGTVNTSDPECVAYTSPGGGGGSYADAGGFVVFLDPQDGKVSFQEKLASLENVGMFDLQMASFVVDFMVFNTNLQISQQVAWKFAFDFAGNCHKAITSRGFNLNLNSSETKYVLLNILKFVLVGCICLFVFLELRKICEVGFFPHFRKFASLVDCFSLFICILAVGSFAYLQSQPIMTDFRFASLRAEESRIETYDKLEQVAARSEELSYVAGLNLLVVFVRALFLVAPLGTNLGIIFKVLEVSMSNLYTFALMFLVCQTAFVTMAHFSFGSGVDDLSTLRMSFYRCFAMMTGKPIYDELKEGDSTMGPLFYFVYYVFFYLVMVNMFISILLNGYDVVDHELKDRTRQERNIIMRLGEELKQDLWGHTGRLLGWGSGAVKFAVKCSAGCVQDMLSCLPKPPAAALKPLAHADLTGRRKGRSHGESNIADVEEVRQTDGKKMRYTARFDLECSLMVTMMAVFLTFANNVINGEEAYLISEVTLEQQIYGATWTEADPERSEDLSDIRTFEQVESWARSFLETMYSNTQCAVSVSGGSVMQSLEAGSCDRELDTQQRVQILGGYNTGFMNTTFVRLTLQPACFQSEASLSRWTEMSPIWRHTPVMAQCSSEGGCIDVLSEKSCRTSDGQSLALDTIDNISVSSGSGVKYNFSLPHTELGAHQMHGGFVFSFGTSSAEAMSVLEMLVQDSWFSQKSASMVFDWITYNGNVDSFAYNSVGFSLLGSGELQKRWKSQVFPLNIGNGGGYMRKWRITNMVLFWAYFCLVLYFTVRYGLDIASEWRKHRSQGASQRSCTKFVRSWFSDLWHWSDLISLVLSVTTIVYVFMYVFHSFRNDYFFSTSAASGYKVPNPDVKKYAMAKSVDPSRPMQEDWYIFLQFEKLESMYRTITLIAGLNSFFIAIKVGKYVGRLDRVKPFSHTLNTGMGRNFAFAFSMMMGMVGFSFFFFLVFGHQASGFNTFSQTLFTIFDWIVGNYDLTGLFEVHFEVAFVFFVIYMVAFYVIGVNMFLATMLNTYSEQVGNLDIERAKAFVKRKRKYVEVEYHDEAALLKDIVFGVKNTSKAADGKVYYIKDLPNKAARARGLSEGCILLTVNKKRPPTTGSQKSELEALLNFLRDEGFNFVLRFLDNSGVDGLGKSNSTGQTMPIERTGPTVKNFWIDQGAVASVDRNLFPSMVANPATGRGTPGPVDALEGELEPNAADEEEDDRVGEGEEEKADGGAGGGAGGGVHIGVERLRKDRTKSRLERLLFSRWEYHGRDGAALDTAGLWMTHDGTPSGDCDIFEAVHYNIHDMREWIRSIPISGHEAWLDVLMTALEYEFEDESVVAEMLQTSELQEWARFTAQTGVAPEAVPKLREVRPAMEFYKHASTVLQVLENKAQKKYFQFLRQESEQKQKRLREENVVLHEYISALENKFQEVSTTLQEQKAAKVRLLGLLSSTLGQEPPKEAGLEGSSEGLR